jgi:hypothetical protein
MTWLLITDQRVHGRGWQAWDAAKNCPPLAAWRAAIAGCLAELGALGMDKMRAKAQEVEADKKVYGEAMRAKASASIGSPSAV